MKLRLILFAAIIGFAFSSCHDLELQPKGILDEPALFGTAYGVQKYFVQAYERLPIEDFIYYVNTTDQDLTNNFIGYMQGNANKWQAYKNSQAQMDGEIYGWNVAMNGAGFGYWPYAPIRYINTFINNFPNYKDKYDAATYNSLLAEGRFLRAFYYEGLAKRYGGVPIITDVQDPVNGDPATLSVPRNTEYDTWKFIQADLTFAMANMSATSVSGRANKYVAAALMSRAMLYAGRVAKYTQFLGLSTDASVQKGFAGMDPSKATEFFQASYDAGLFIKQGPYSLYTKNYPDKATNFANLFLDKSSSETMFVKGYDGQTFGHCYDALMLPNPDMSSFVGSEGYPAFEIMQLYDFPSLVDAQGKPVRFNKRGDIKIGMEPRLQGTCFFDGDVCHNVAFEIQRGIYLHFGGLASDAQSGSNNAPVNATTNRLLGASKGSTYQGVLLSGRHGMSTAGSENNCFNGAFMRKYIDPTRTTALTNVNKSNQSWIVFRLAEIYLNTAEAAYELGKRTEALDYVEMIRVRAGCQVTRPALNQTTSSTYGYPIEASLQFIRDERLRELFAENHYWWDLKTWRIVDQVLNLHYPRALSAYYVFDEGKYIFIDEVNRDNRAISAPKSAAYEKIPQAEINKNTNLLPQNPLY